ncbi:hypothetical protein CgunFtcFv8_003226 [Champsocephalus gunnari]|uniref:SRCR domain-containing protein n=1 Tax=Champsocephalus gunnari TaxID=52237 RepID=A0AAN8D8Y6_CHAGU|nr:hypothetical protein CgunFtcFv8_003226 [Champsocephalus gunnari]
MRGQRVMENECRCWNPAVWLLVSLLGSLVLVAVSVLRHGDLKINRRAVNTDVSMQYQDVGVTCREPSVLVAKGFRTTPPRENHGIRDGTIRLLDGYNSCQGRVEVFYQGDWGTVCDDEWSLENAVVVCHQLGCGNAVHTHTNSYFGYGTGRILLDNVNCYGSEPDLTRCKSLPWGKHNCGHHEDAGVTCTGTSTVPPLVTENQRGLWVTYTSEATESIPVTNAPTTKTVTTTALTKGKPTIRLVNVARNGSCPSASTWAGVSITVAITRMLELSVHLLIFTLEMEVSLEQQRRYLPPHQNHLKEC